MRLFGKNLGTDVVIIAEIGVNHEGDVEKASELLRLAAESGADAVKFQSYTPERFIAGDDPVRFSRVSRFQLDEEAHRRLAAEAAELGVRFLSTPVSEDWVPLLATLGSAMKIASGDLTFEPVVRAAAATGLPVILSTGLGTPVEIDRAVQWVLEELPDDVSLAERLVLLHCVAAYPVPLEQANLASIPFLAQRYGVAVGYSNHVIGLDAVFGAIALGASVVEVHFTDCKTGREFRDHQLSVDADDMRRLVDMAPKLKAAVGRFGKERQAVEEGMAEAFRKGLVAARDLPAGAVIAKGDLMFARPATEFSWNDECRVLGKTLVHDLKRGMQLRRAMLSD